jgi:hypothetical protein
MGTPFLQRGEAPLTPTYFVQPQKELVSVICDVKGLQRQAKQSIEFSPTTLIAIPAGVDRLAVEE